MAATLLLASTLASGHALAADGFSLGNGTLNGSKAGSSKADETTTANLQPDDESYKKICDAFGEGFVYAANGVCVKIGGFVKFGTSFGGGSLYRR
ncbi:porin [Kaistia dalseonensis]|uniref:Porin n=1 Tax=Kaistia dalseonensis TaxID=410840 RepID=A0ABU0HD23_9HYPH|nr:porin [Kaistia dalseonensis]MCX5496769.1 porin [Kaistia dalseonensis]MDQ0439394.1 hypothetical protein [Kaistia dalseonensis]